MTIKFAVVLLWIILFIAGLIRIFLLGDKDKVAKLRSTYIVITICTIIMGASLTILLNFTTIGDEYLIEPQPEEEEIELKEVAKVYKVENIYYLYDKGYSKDSKYLVTIVENDGAKKIVEFNKNDLVIYNTIAENEEDYIEIYKDDNAKVYLKDTTIDVQTNNENITVGNVESAESAEEIEDEANELSTGSKVFLWIIGIVGGATICILIGIWLEKNIL